MLTDAHDLPGEQGAAVLRWWAGRAPVAPTTFSANLRIVLAGNEVRRAKLRFGLLAGAVGLLVFLILFQQALLGSLLFSFIGAIENQSGTVLVYSEEARKNLRAASILLPEQADRSRRSTASVRSGPLGEDTFTVEADGTDTDASIFGFEPAARRTDAWWRVACRRAPREAVASTEDSRRGFDIGDTVTSVAGDDRPHHRRPHRAEPLLGRTDDVGHLRRASRPCARPPTPTPRPCCRRRRRHARRRASRPAEVAAAINEQVDGVEALTRDQAVGEAPGVSSVNTSFSIILLLAFLVVAVVIGFFFLILTFQKQSSLTVLRAVGAPTGYLVKALLIQIASWSARAGHRRAC